jgi:hypothetical protein
VHRGIHRDLAAEIVVIFGLLDGSGDFVRQELGEALQTLVDKAI